MQHTVVTTKMAINTIAPAIKTPRKMKIKNKIEKAGVNLDEGLEKNYSLKGFWKKQDS